jgi:HlyD family secretion protein
MRKPLLLLVAGVAVAAAASAYHYVEKSNDQPVFRLAPVEKGRLISAVTSSGTLNAVVTVQVGSQVSGQIEELLADFNSEVRKGQIIARIDPENFEARVLQAEAELDVAQANVSIQQAAVIRSRAELENAQASLAAARAQAEKAKVAVEDARRDLNRKQTLHKNNIISKSEIDKAMATYDQALAQYQTSLSDERAQASLVNSRKASLKMAEEQVVHALAQVKHQEAVLHQSKVDLEHTIIRSPVNGVVIERSVDMGQTVAASLQAPTLFTIAQDLRKMQVETAIDEADIGRIRVGQRVIFTVDAFSGHEFHGRVEKIRMAPQTLQNVVTYTVVVSAENPDLRLLPGMTANAKVVVEERAEALKVPNAALRFKPTGKGNHEAVPRSNLGAVNDLSDHSGIPQEKLERLVQALKLDENQQAQVSAIFA